MKDIRSELQRVRNQQVEIERKREELVTGLPHLYRYKWYQWAYNFYMSRNRMNLLTAANQVSKSSTQIRKCIEWAGNPSLWEELWPGKQVRQMWYFYPTYEIVSMEFATKWVPEFLPAGKYKDEHSTYGWKMLKDQGKIIGIYFNSGMTVYFRSYSQDLAHLQAGTVGAIFCDEELPEEMYDELNMRLVAVDGYFHMVFTPTLNQTIWRLAMEGVGDQEKWPAAFKQQISMYDCQKYMDGTPGAYSKEKVLRVIRSCKSQVEINRRVYGKFVTEQGRKYYGFDNLLNVIKPFPIPKSWKRYAAVDIGSGGDGHPPAITFIAVQPDYRYAVAYRGWRGDDGGNYTSSDIYQKYVALRGQESMIEQKYDQASRDFRTITDRASDTFMSSDKSHERGEETVNNLFKNKMLAIFDDDPELAKLVEELMSIMKHTPKNKAKDDFCDSLRYAVTGVPWDWSVLTGKKSETEIQVEKARPYTDAERVAMEIEERRGAFFDPHKTEDEDWEIYYNEVEDWNQLYG